MWFDSNAVEMMSAEHYKYVKKFCELLAYQFYSCGELKFYVWIYVCLIILTGGNLIISTGISCFWKHSFTIASYSLFKVPTH